MDMDFDRRLQMLQDRSNQATALRAKLRKLEFAEPRPGSQFTFEKARNVAGHDLSQELLLEIFSIGRAELIRRVQVDLTAVLSEPLFPPELPKDIMAAIARDAAIHDPNVKWPGAAPKGGGDLIKQRCEQEQCEGTPPDMRSHESYLKVNDTVVRDTKGNPIGAVVDSGINSNRDLMATISLDRDALEAEVSREDAEMLKSR